MTVHERDALRQHGVRIQKMEETNRRLRWVVCTLVAFVWVSILLGSSPQGRDTVEASAFVVRDEDGKSIARLGYGVNHSAELILFDTEGKERASLRVARGNEPQMTLTGKNAQTLAALGISDDGSADLVFGVGPDAMPRAQVGITESGSASLIFWDETGEPRVLMGSPPRAWVSLGVTEQRPVSSIVLMDREGKTVFKAP